MENLSNRKPAVVCCVIFLICLCVRFFEYFVIRTDTTVVSENIIHKVFGIVLLAAALKMSGLSFGEIGFRKNGFASGFFQGILLGLICFAISYAIELIVLRLQSQPAHLELYISGFSITGSQTKNTDIVFFVICIIFNIVNVFMEEGIFRGFFIKTMSGKYSFTKANMTAALLFGVWHFVMPVRSFIYGEMSFGSMLFMSLGYIVLSGLMSIKWGLLYRISGHLWIGIGDHLFNNAVATNMLHVVTSGGADTLQIVRVMLAQLISFATVAVVSAKKSHKSNV